MSKQGRVRGRETVQMPRDLPMPDYRFQQDSGSTQVISAKQPQRASCDLLRGCNLGAQ